MTPVAFPDGVFVLPSTFRSACAPLIKCHSLEKLAWAVQPYQRLFLIYRQRFTFVSQKPIRATSEVLLQPRLREINPQHFYARFSSKPAPFSPSVGAIEILRHIKLLLLLADLPSNTSLQEWKQFFFSSPSTLLSCVLTPQGWNTGATLGPSARLQ